VTSTGAESSVPSADWSAMLTVTSIVAGLLPLPAVATVPTVAIFP